MQMNPVRKSRKLINSSIFFFSSHQISTVLLSQRQQDEHSINRQTMA